MRLLGILSLGIMLGLLLSSVLEAVFRSLP